LAVIVSSPAEKEQSNDTSSRRQRACEYAPRPPIVVNEMTTNAQFLVPWARDPSISHLATPDQMKSLLVGVGFKLLDVQDSTEESQSFFERMTAEMAKTGSPPVAWRLFLGEDFPAMARNQVHNVSERRIRTVSYICVAVTNTDLTLIAVVSEALTTLGIEHSVYFRPRADASRKDVRVIEVRKGPAMSRFGELVPIRAPEKRRKLDEALASYRGLHCFGCGCLHDEMTPGCTNCRKRHAMRKRPKSGGEV
jgi:hypothetical protein